MLEPQCCMLILWPAEHAQHIHVLCVTLRVCVHCRRCVTVQYSTVRKHLLCVTVCFTAYHVVITLCILFSSLPVTTREFFLSRVVHLSLGTPKMAHVFVMDVMMPGCMEE